MTALGVQDSSSLRDYWPITYPEHEERPRAISVVTGGNAPWWPAVERRLVDLIQLPTNWDGRGSRVVNPADLLAAVRFLAEVMRPDTKVPWISPLGTGGVQLAWKRGDVEAEAVFDQARGEAVLLVGVGENEWEEPIRTAPSLFATVIERLSAAEYSA